MMQKSVGIIGDGQLGMMLCAAAVGLRLHTVMLTTDRNSPAARCADAAVQGAMDDEQALAALIERCDVVTYEREDLPAPAIAQLRRAEAAGAIQCFPPLSCVEMIQDKAKQKRWLAEHKLATLPFIITAGGREALHGAARQFGYPLVQKALRGGFDGRGVQLLHSAAALDHAWPGTTLLEQHAGDFREIAVLIARARDGAMRHFGPVDMRFENRYCVLDTVSAPAAIDAASATAAVELARAAIAAMRGVGVFGVEMFLLATGEVLINEISPRVHNAGHYSIEACAHSQFELHLRAVSGLPLVSTQLQRPAAMKNLLCTPALEAEGHTRAAATQAVDRHTTVHWYGKSPARPMRKLGHITATGDSAPQALARATRRWELIQQQAREKSQEKAQEKSQEKIQEKGQENTREESGA